MKALLCYHGKKSLGLSLIEPHSNLDQIPDSASLICSNADHPMRRKSKKSVQVSKQSQSVFTRKQQIPTKSVLQEKYVNQCVIQEVQEVQEETSKQKSPAFVINHLCDDENCQVSRCVHMLPVKPAKKSNNLQSVEPAIQSSYKKLCSDKNCQSIRCFKKMNQVCGDDKNYQSIQCMWLVKSARHMQSMTKPMWSMRRPKML